MTFPSLIIASFKRQLLRTVCVALACVPLCSLGQEDVSDLADSTYQKYRFGKYAVNDYFVIDTSASYRENDSTFQSIISRYDGRDVLVARYPVVSENAVQLDGPTILFSDSVGNYPLIHGSLKDGRLDFGVFFVYDEDMILLSALKFRYGQNAWNALDN